MFLFFEMIELICYVVEFGYLIVFVLLFYYYKLLIDDGLVVWYLVLYEVFGDSFIEIYFYNYFQMMGIIIFVEVIGCLCQYVFVCFIGIKDFFGDFVYCRVFVVCFEGFVVFFSFEVLFGEVLVFGFVGCILVMINQIFLQFVWVWQDCYVFVKVDFDDIFVIWSVIVGLVLVVLVKFLVVEWIGNFVWICVMLFFVFLNDD